MVRPQDFMNELRSQIQDNITDPNQDRRGDGAPWVFTHQPHIGSLPTVEISQVSGNYDDRSIGTAAQFERARIQVTVRVRENNEYDYDIDDELETASDGLDYLVTAVVDRVVDNHGTIISNIGGDAHHLIPDVRGPVDDDPNTDTVEQPVDFIAFMDRGA